MTKAELIKEIKEMEELKQVHLENINYNCNKSELENALCCLACDDEKLDEYLVIIKLKYPNIYNTIKNNGNWKQHSFNRLYVYNTARLILA